VDAAAPPAGQHGAVPVLPALPPVADDQGVLAWVSTHLGALTLEGPDGVRAGAVRGGQQAADATLAALDVEGYSRSRSTVLPVSRRGATRISPYVRYGLLQLPHVWDAVTGASPRDRDRYRDELLWQEYARHVYARTGTAMRKPLRHMPPEAHVVDGDPWVTDMACISSVHSALVEDGWLVNQTRMWMSSHWTVRHGRDWREGEDEFFTHLLDGSRAANRLGWQWTVGAGTGRPYGFSRWQVEKRAPALCAACPLRDRCPIEGWPDAAAGRRVDGPHLGAGPTPSGPDEPVVTGTPDAVWLTAESLGDADPALTAHPDLPAVFVFDQPLLQRLRLSGKRLVFLAQSLADLAERRPLQVRLGAVPDELAGRRLSGTYAPVPGWQRIARRLDLVEQHPWPWLVRPASAPLSSFSAWRKAVRR
jgi:deoxyribodipyrimidine photo-lyase